MPPRKKQKGKGAAEVLSAVHKFVKDNKLISKGLGYIPSPYAQIASKGAGMLGYGRRKKPQRGKGIFSDLGGGIGSVFGGLGSGIGSVAHGFFGSGRQTGGSWAPMGIVSPNNGLTMVPVRRIMV